MGMIPRHYYSVYKRRTDEPVIIHAKAPECLEATGLTKSSFYSYVTWTRYGSRKRKYLIYVDDPDEEDEDGGQE